MEIIPAIIAKDINEVKAQLALVEGWASGQRPEYVEWAQIDVMDGVFTPPTTFHEPALLRDIQAGTKLEAHLMVSHPENTIEEWLNSPVSRILLHYESTTPEILKDLIVKIKDAGKEPGIALKLETPISVLDDFLHSTLHPPKARLAPKGGTLHSIQLMGISEIGYHGHPFDERVLEKISALHKKYPDVIIAVDGGVNDKTIPLIVRAGAERLIVGKAIFGSENPKEEIKNIKNNLLTY